MGREYYFESKNRDNLKTSFDIQIYDLNNIIIKFISDEEPVEIYSNLKSPLINPDKIKIIFNAKYEENGYINIEKKEANYYISGDIIYLVNPGSDNFPIQKVK